MPGAQVSSVRISKPVRHVPSGPLSESSEKLNVIVSELSAKGSQIRSEPQTTLPYFENEQHGDIKKKAAYDEGLHYFRLKLLRSAEASMFSLSISEIHYESASRSVAGNEPLHRRRSESDASTRAIREG